VNPRKHILEHVEEVEYAKESARRIAESVLQTVDVRELGSNPRGVVDHILAVIFAKLGPAAQNLAALSAAYAVVLGLPKLSNAMVRELTEEAQRKFYAFAAPAMHDAALQVGSRVNDMVASGVDTASVTTALNDPAAVRALMVPLSAVTKRVSSSWMQFVDRDVNDAAVAAAVEPPKQRVRDRVLSFVVTGPLFTWIAVMDGNTCDGKLAIACAPRHGLAKPLIEWRFRGVPGSPVLICSMHSPRGASPCRCVLASAKDLEAIEAIDASDAIKRGKERARRRR
jgi:hypothetical protein